MLRFIDVSNWQRGMDLAAVVRNGGLAGAVVKATEGVGYVDPDCDGFVRQLREAGALFGFYHFARNNNASAEAEFFRKNTVGYEGEGIPVLDWEADQSVAWVNKFVERYHELTGVWPWVYANPWRFRQGAVNPNCGRWVAGYPRAGITDIDYGISNALPSSYDVGGVCAWQFSSSVRISGYGGNLDGDVFYGDEGAWMAYAGGGTHARLGFADAAAEVMEHLCTHSAHGYSQPNRQGVGTGGAVAETVTLSDGTRVGIAAYDRDCSSAVIECFAAQGVDCAGATYTGNMRSRMVASGNFRALPASTWRNPRRGDLLLTERNGHVAMALGGGKLGEFLRSENHTIHGKVGDQDGGESVIRPLYDDGWDCVLRYCGPEPEGVNETGQTVAGAGRYIVVSPDGLNVRAEPSTSAEIVAQYSTGDTVNLDGWTTTGDGWVWGRYVGASSGKHRYVAIGHPGDNSLLAPSGGSIVVGSKVKVTNPYDEHGTRLAVSGTYEVVQVNGSRVVIARGGTVIAAIDAANLALA